MQSGYLNWHAQTVNRGHRSRNELGNREFKNFEFLLKLHFNCDVEVEGKHLLDIGSADDHFVNAIDTKMLTHSITGKGIDLNVDLIPYEDETFDFVTSFACIEHIRETSHYLSEIKRVLKKGGIIFLTTPNWKYCYREFFDEPTHYTPFTPRRIESALTIEGFVGEEVYPGLRLKPKFMYRGRFRFKLASLIPFVGDSKFRKILPALCGQSRSIIAIAQKPIGK